MSNMMLGIAREEWIQGFSRHGDEDGLADFSNLTEDSGSAYAFEVAEAVAADDLHLWVAANRTAKGG